jgi:3-deoxy-7-phosphoheptulonate synthase
LEQVLSPHLKKAYEKVVRHIVDGVNFVDVVAGAAYAPVRDSVEFFTSHEALLLEYEEALTRQVANKHYDLSAHLVWIGDRTRDPESGHVEFCRGISNPVAFKVGPTATPEGVVGLVRRLNPNKIPGRLTLITRFGCGKVEQLLPPIVRAVLASGVPVLWVCDPCHGNTIVSAFKIKTRNFSDILQEVQLTMHVLQEAGTHLGGVHVELTGENVTECVGGAAELGEKNLSHCFKSLCDPRLNYAQSLDLAFRIGGELKKNRPRSE